MQVIKLGGTTDIVSSGIADLQIQLPAGGTATVRDIGSKGAGTATRYVLTGATTVPMSGAVKGAKAARADKRPPVTSAALRGGRLVLKARDASKVAVTYVIVGKKQARLHQATSPQEIAT